MSDLVKRLRIKAGMIEMGDMIAWGSDSALMREAADALEMAAPAVQGDPVKLKAFSKGDTYPVGDCGNFVSGINHNITITNPYQWDHQIEVYGSTPEQAEALRDRILGALESPDVQGGVPEETINAVISLVKDAAASHLNSEFGSCLSKIRKLLTAAPQPAEQQPSAGDSLTSVPDEVFAAEFAAWWDEHGQFCRAGGGTYEQSFAFEAWRHLYPQLMNLQMAAAEPDVSRQVEALESIAKLPIDPCSTENDYRLSAAKAIASAAISAHRKGGEK